jgi:hypothetical protein
LCAVTNTLMLTWKTISSSTFELQQFKLCAHAENKLSRVPFATIPRGCVINCQLSKSAAEIIKEPRQSAQETWGYLLTLVPIAASLRKITLPAKDC